MKHIIILLITILPFFYSCNTLRLKERKTIQLDYFFEFVNKYIPMTENMIEESLVHIKKVEKINIEEIHEVLFKDLIINVYKSKNIFVFGVDSVQVLFQEKNINYKGTLGKTIFYNWDENEPLDNLNIITEMEVKYF